jgi:hypothetical protein
MLRAVKSRSILPKPQGDGDYSFLSERGESSRPAGRKSLGIRNNSALDVDS